MPITGFDEKIKGTLIKVWAVRDYIVIFTVPLPVTAALGTIHVQCHQNFGLFLTHPPTTLKSLINEQTGIIEQTGIVLKFLNQQTGMNEYAGICLKI